MKKGNCLNGGLFIAYVKTEEDIEKNEDEIIQNETMEY